MSIPGINNTGYFYWQGLCIQQLEVVHKVGTDAVLLGAWTCQVIKAPIHILDAGTGTGILALLLATKFPGSSIRAVDIDERALDLATSNVKSSGLQIQIAVAFENIFLPSDIFERKFDLVVSNPPFYDGQFLPRKDYKVTAKHSRVPTTEWVKGLLNRSSPEAHFAIIVPAQSAAEWIHAFNENQYYNKDRLDVYSFETDLFPKRSLLHFTKGLPRPVIHRLDIYAPDNTYTTAYLNLTGIQPR